RPTLAYSRPPPRRVSNGLASPEMLRGIRSLSPHTPAQAPAHSLGAGGSRRSAHRVSDRDSLQLRPGALGHPAVKAVKRSLDAEGRERMKVTLESKTESLGLIAKILRLFEPDAASVA